MSETNNLIKLLQSNDDPKIIDIYLENRDVDGNKQIPYSYYDEFYHTYHNVSFEHMVTLYGNLRTLNSLLVLPIFNINAKSSYGYTMLHFACVSECVSNRLDVVRRLLEIKNLDTEATNMFGQTAFNLAVFKGSDELIQLLITHGVNINASSPTGHALYVGRDADIMNWSGSSLMDAIQCGRKNIFDMLLDSGADVNIPNLHGQTPLHFAIMFGYGEDTIRKLLEHGSDVNSNNPTGFEWNKSPLSWVEHEKPWGGGSPLAYVVKTRFNQKENIKLLLDCGADVNNVNINNGMSILMESCNSNCSLDTFELLLDRGADVGQRDIHGQTALHKMSPYLQEHYNFEQIIIKLLDRGADINSQDNSGQTLLHLIAGSRYSDKIKISNIRFLLDRGADPNICNFSNQIPLHLCVSSNIDLFKLLDR